MLVQKFSDLFCIKICLQNSRHMAVITAQCIALCISSQTGDPVNDPVYNVCRMEDILLTWDCKHTAFDT